MRKFCHGILIETDKGVVGPVEIDPEKWFVDSQRIDRYGILTPFDSTQRTHLPVTRTVGENLIVIQIEKNLVASHAFGSDIEIFVKRSRFDMLTKIGIA